MFPLINGECKVDQIISFETEAAFINSTQAYNEVLVHIIGLRLI
jgi:hypothetical protein